MVDNTESADELNRAALDAANKGDFPIARELLIKALEFDPRNINSLYLLSRVSLSLGGYTEVIRYADVLLDLKPGDVNTRLNKGVALVKLRRLDEALDNFGIAHKFAPSRIDVILNKVNVLIELGFCADAFDLINPHIKIYESDFSIVNTYSALLHQLGRHTQSVEYAKRALQLNPNYDSAHVNIANSFLALKKTDVAREYFVKALELNTKNYEAIIGLASILVKEGKSTEAVTLLERYCVREPSAGRIWFYVGLIFAEDLNSPSQAIKYFEIALELDPHISCGLGWLLSAKLSACDWRTLDSTLALISNGINKGQLTILPFHALLIFDDASALQVVSTIFSKLKLHQAAVPCSRGLDHDSALGSRRPKIRIAYFSPDFNNHPVARLVLELLESHTRDDFEVICFYTHPRLSDHVTDRFKKSVDEFFFCGELSDDEFERLVVSKELDIAIDLGGYTRHSRFKVFSLPIATVKINYLGFPGSLGTGHYDYILADQVIIPESMENYFSERVIRFEGCYQPNSEIKEEDILEIERRTLKLEIPKPQFCCLNAMNRVNPFIAKIWSKVLHALPNSCLTLLCGDPVGAKNFTDFMLRCGIEEGRIFFIDRADYEVHLRRQSDFDLFLDTTPYNAHTTASDALRRGLPIVTLLGSTFSGRVAASLLFELGIPELVCSDETEYVDTCVRFACDLSFRANIHSKLRNALLTGHLFNPRKKVIELESILKSLLLPVTNMR